MIIKQWTLKSQQKRYKKYNMKRKKNTQGLTKSTIFWNKVIKYIKLVKEMRISVWNFDQWFCECPVKKTKSSKLNRVKFIKENGKVH